MDIETSGIDPDQDQVLEIGFVVDDLLKEVPLNWGRIVICHDRIYGDPYALQMNSELLIEIHNNGNKLSKYVHTYNDKIFTHSVCYTKPDYAIGQLKQMIANLYGVNAINLAGKNLGSFDIPFLKQLDGFEFLKYNRRIIDPSVFYLQEEDSVVPNLSQCLERANMKPTNLHSAVGDAFDVCRLIRHGMNKNTNIPNSFLQIKDVMSSC